MNINNILLACFIGYAFGCIQTAYLVGRIVKKTDIRLHGSNNAGASNVTQVIGWKYGILTAAVDILKATAAVLLMKYMFPEYVTLHFLTGAFVILGHVFPLYLGFRGGKGAASIIGMVLALDFKIALLLIMVIVIITIVLDYIALGTLAMFTLFPFSTYFFDYPLVCTLIAIVLAILCYYKHSINIMRILRGEENGLRQVARRR